MASTRAPRNHRTVDRVTRIVEEVRYRPGMTLAELSRVIGAPKSSVHSFISGLLAQGWLYEVDHCLYLGPTVYGLTLASGHVRAGAVTHADLQALHLEAQTAVFLGVQAGEHVIYIAEVGTDPVAGYEARSNIRRMPLATAAGKVLLAALSDPDLEAYLGRREAAEGELVEGFRAELDQIRATRIAINFRRQRRRIGIAAALPRPAGEVVAAVILVGPEPRLAPRESELREVLLRHVDSWPPSSAEAREAI